MFVNSLASSASLVEVRIVLDQGEGARARPPDELQILGQACELQVRHPRLLRVEQRPLAAEPEVLVGQLEAVGRAHHRIDPCLSFQVLRVGGVEQHAEASVGAAADPPSELV